MVDVWRSVSTSTLLRAAEETLDSRANIYFPNLTYLNILIIVCHNLTPALALALLPDANTDPSEAKWDQYCVIAARDAP